MREQLQQRGRVLRERTTRADKLAAKHMVLLATMQDGGSPEQVRALSAVCRLSPCRAERCT